MKLSLPTWWRDVGDYFGNPRFTVLHHATPSYIFVIFLSKKIINYKWQGEVDRNRWKNKCTKIPAAHHFYIIMAFLQFSEVSNEDTRPKLVLYKNRSQNRGIFVFTERKGSRFFGYFLFFFEHRVKQSQTEPLAQNGLRNKRNRFVYAVCLIWQSDRSHVENRTANQSEQSAESKNIVRICKPLDR